MDTDPARAAQRRTKVWDLFVRLFHWTLVAAFFAAYLTEDDTLTIHVWAGYLVGGLVAMRIAWGFVGPKHARFTDFIYGPRTVIGYMRDLVAFRAKRYIGHSPAGGAMVVALLIVLPLVVWSGLELYAAEENAGPLAAASTAALVAAPALADDDDDGRRGRGRGGDDEKDGPGDLHEALAHLAFLLVLFHVGGVALASLAHRENLARAMVTGYKRDD